MQKKSGGVKKPHEALRSLRKQQNPKGNVWKPQESSGSYKTKLTTLVPNVEFIKINDMLPYKQCSDVKCVAVLFRADHCCGVILS